MKENYVELKVIGLSYHRKWPWLRKIFPLLYQRYYLTFRLKDNINKGFSMLIGQHEAEAIAIVLENMIPERPLTHDTFKSTTDKINMQLISVNIDSMDTLKRYFISTLHYKLGENYYQIDSRASDAIALALRHKCPIYIDKKVFEMNTYIMN